MKRFAAALPTCGHSRRPDASCAGLGLNACQDDRVAPVIGFVTFVDLDDGPADACGASVSARQRAVLGDGREVVVLDDRGWTWITQSLCSAEVVDPWTDATRKDIEETARVVVGPEEPFGGRSAQDMADDHWRSIAERLHEQGVDVSADELPGLPHKVMLSERLSERIPATN